MEIIVFTIKVMRYIIVNKATIGQDDKILC